MTNSQPIRIFLIEPSVRILLRLKEQFAGLERFRLVGTSSRGAQAKAVIADLRDGVDVVIVDLDAPDGLDTVRSLAGLVPAIVGASIPGLPQSVLDQATAAGVTRHTNKPFSTKELLTDIREAHRRARMNQEFGTPSAADTPIGRLLLVLAAKGGVGTSLVAANLAVGFREGGGTSVTLIDADLQFGDQATLCAAPSGPNITDFFDGHRQWAAKDLPSLLRDAAGGVRLLAAPDNPRHADLVTPERFSALLSEFRRLSSLVLMDCPSHLTDLTLSALERADDIVVVSDFSASSVQATKTLLTSLASLAIPPEKIQVVLNDARPPAELSRETAETRLGRKAISLLPNDSKTVQAAAKAGLPILAVTKKTALAAALNALLSQLTAPLATPVSVPTGPPKKKSRGRLFSNHSK
jgi:pilus assembly protein CpaE